MKEIENLFIVENIKITLENYKNFSFRKENSPGSLLIFEGLVRNNNNNKNVSYIIYDVCYEFCLLKIKEIYLYCNKKYCVTDFLLIHRVGKTYVGEISLLLFLYSKHRKEGIYACNYILDRIKLDVPIWKKEFYNVFNNCSWI